MASRAPDGQEWGSYYDSKLRSYMERNSSNNVRQEKNWKVFSGVNFGQWDRDALQQLVNEKRPPHQINFLQHKINTLLGNYLQNPFEAAFESNVLGSNKDAILLNNLRTADANRGKWSKAKRLFLRSGLIFRGIMELYKDYRYDPLGNLSWRYWNPFRIEFDPNWDTDNINDNAEILINTWMDPTEIMRVYNKKTEEIRSAVNVWKLNSANPGYELEKDNLADRSPLFYNNLNGKYLVIQGVRMEYITTEKLFDTKTVSFLPDMSPENKRAVLSIRGSELKVVKDQVGICKLTTTVPGLAYNLVLDEGNHPIQIGRYPFMTWSAMNLHGEVQGVVDILRDPQEIFNKRESTFTHWQTSASNGVELIEEDFFAEGEYEKYLDAGNVPGQKFKVNPGKLSAERGNGLQLKDRGTPPNDLHVSADRALAISDTLSATPPAISGGEGKSGESGRLFNSKRMQALVSLEPMSESIQEKDEEALEMYFRGVKQVYRGAPRLVSGGKNPIYLNLPQEDGTIMNDIDNLQRQNIIVTQSRKGISVKRDLANAYTDALSVIRNPVLQTLIEANLVKVLPNIPDSEIEQSQEVANEFLELQRARIKAEKNQLQQAGQQNVGTPQAGISPPGKTPAEGGGFSVEGKEISTGGGIPVDMRQINQLQ